MRQSPWRPIAFAVALLIACIWAGGAGWYVMQQWPVRAAMARVELSREEIACGNRSASPANQQRCRDLAGIMSSAEQAEWYFIDGLIVFGPTLALLGFGWWVRRSQRSGGRSHHSRHHHRPHPRPSATA
ncbi:MAG: hypothetical protein FJX54_22825 [Alphaproteobacteria bacterium]|nr:hypothetical protein [Alphaproteobacteria bacterium]